MSDSSPTNRSTLNRRQLLRLSTAVGVGAVLPSLSARSPTARRRPPVPRGHVQHASHGGRDHAVRQGARLRRGRRAHLQGRAVRRPDRRREPLAAGEAADAVGRRIPRADLRRQLSAAPARLGERADVPLPVDGRLAERGHAQGEHLDAEPHRQASGDVLHPRRRLHVRLGLRAGLAGRRADGAAPRRRLGDRQPSPQHPRLPRPLRVRRPGLRRFGQRRHDRPGGGAPVGARQHRELRRRPGPRDDLRPVGRRVEGHDAARHAVGAGADPSRVGAVGRWRQSARRPSSRGSSPSG